jgi:hypothetical protein
MKAPEITLAHNACKLRIDSSEVTIFADEVVVVKVQFFDDSEPSTPRLVGELILEGDHLLELARHLPGTLIRVGAQHLNLQFMKELKREA